MAISLTTASRCWKKGDLEEACDVDWVGRKAIIVYGGERATREDIVRGFVEAGLRSRREVLELADLARNDLVTRSDISNSIIDALKIIWFNLSTTTMLYDIGNV